MISTMPTQNMGSDKPRIDRARTTISSRRLRIVAEATPAKTPSPLLTASDTRASSMVGGMRSKIIRRMGTPLLIDKPRSPRARREMKLAYWALIGLSRPQTASTCASWLRSMTWF